MIYVYYQNIHKMCCVQLLDSNKSIKCVAIAMVNQKNHNLFLRVNSGVYASLWWKPGLQRKHKSLGGDSIELLQSATDAPPGQM